jgi:hypothetical protein
MDSPTRGRAEYVRGVDVIRAVSLQELFSEGKNGIVSCGWTLIKYLPFLCSRHIDTQPLDLMFAL